MIFWISFFQWISNEEDKRVYWKNFNIPINKFKILKLKKILKLIFIKINKKLYTKKKKRKY